QIVKVMLSDRAGGEMVVSADYFSSRRRHTRCYRDWSSDVCSSDLGMKELDVMLERFAHHALPDACPRERQALEELLSLPDPVLAAYLLGESTPPEPHLAALAGAIRAYVAKEGGSALF